MRKIALLSAIGLWASLALAGGAKVLPLNIKTGLWQTTLNMKISGLPPQMAAAMPGTITYKSCLTKEKLNQYPFVKKDCTWTVGTSTGSKMDAEGVCTLGGGERDRFTAHLQVVDSEHVKGTGTQTMSGGGSTLHGDYAGTSKYLGPVCGNTE